MRVAQKLMKLREHWFIAAFGVAVPLALFGLFVGYPICYNVVLSFMKWNGLAPRLQPVGISNYAMLANAFVFWMALFNTIKWLIGTVLLANVFGLLFAAVLQPRQVYLSTLFRSLTFLPVTMSLVSVGIMFAFILDPNFGIVSHAMRALGLHSAGPELLGDPRIAIYSLIAVFGWSYVAVPMIIYHAGISQISPELHEAAWLEGAGRSQIFRYVTIPSLRSVLVVVTIYSVIQGFRNFDLIATVTSGGPGNATSVLGFYMYILAFESVWHGAAVSTLILVLSLLFVVTYLRRVGHNTLYASET